MQEKNASRQKYYAAEGFDPLLDPELPVAIFIAKRQILLDLASRA